jgi:hypothetical protein
MIEGSGFITLTNGSGSGYRKPKNTWIRIRNTGLQTQRLENADKIMYPLYQGIETRFCTEFTWEEITGIDFRLKEKIYL